MQQRRSNCTDYRYTIHESLVCELEYFVTPLITYLLLERRDVDFGQAVPGAPPAGHRDPGPGGGGLVRRARSARCECGLALQNGGCVHQTPQPLLSRESVTEEQDELPRDLFARHLSETGLS